MTMNTDAPAAATEITARTKTLITGVCVMIRSTQNAALFTDHKVNAPPKGPHVPKIPPAKPL